MCLRGFALKLKTEKNKKRKQTLMLEAVNERWSNEDIKCTEHFKKLDHIRALLKA